MILFGMIATNVALHERLLGATAWHAMPGF